LKKKTKILYQVQDDAPLVDEQLNMSINNVSIQ